MHFVSVLLNDCVQSKETSCAHSVKATETQGQEQPEENT